MANISIYLRKDRVDKLGLCQVQIQIKSGKYSFYHKVENVKIKPKDWNSKEYRVKDSDPNSKLLNRKIKSDLIKIQKSLLSMDEREIGFNRDELKCLLYGNGSLSLYDFWIRTMESRDGVLSFNSKRIYKTDFNKLKEFRPSLTFDEITLDFLEMYESWLRITKKNKPNTIRKSMKNLRYMVNRANKVMNTRCKAFDDYKVPGEVVIRHTFELNTLDKMLTHLYKGTFRRDGKVQEALATFCFQALTGLRFSDAVRFNVLEFIHGSNLKALTDKTGRPVYIPLHDRLKELLEFQKFSFQPPTNQATNRILKGIQVALDIPIKLTSHIAVHSFCTISLELGIPIEVISKIRGHANIKTTQIYAQVKNQYIETEMKKWDKSKSVAMVM